MNVFRNSYDYLLNVFGDNSLGFYYVDYKDAIRNTNGEITGGKTYLIKQCPMRGKVVTDQLELKTVTDSSTGAMGFLELDNPCVFKCSATDLLKGGVIDSLGNYPYADDSSTTVVEGIMNHKYVMWHNELYEVLGVQKGVVYKGDLSALYLITTKNVDMVKLCGKSELVIMDTPVTPSTYTVTVDGAVLGSYSVGDVVTLTVPVKEGYTFNGWNSEDVTITDNTFTMPEHNVVVISTWTEIVPVKHKVYVDGVEQGEYSVGDVVTVSTTDREGYTFNGWTSEPTVTFADFRAKTTTFTMIDSDVHVTPVYAEIKLYWAVTITNEGTGGTSSGTIQVERGKSITLESGTRNGYNFNGWTLTSGTGTFSDNTATTTTFTPQSDCAVECVWVSQYHYVYVYDTDGTQLDKDLVKEGNTHHVTAPSKTGYTFTEWVAEGITLSESDKKSRNLTFTMPTNDVSLRPQYEVMVFTVTFMVDNSVYQTQEVVYGNKATRPTDPVKDLHTFDGWFNGSNEFDFNRPVEGDMTLTAHFTHNTATVTWDSVGGSAITPTVVNVGEALNTKLSTLPEPTKDGSSFNGWYYGDTQIDLNYVVTGDVTFTAQWLEASEVNDIDTSKGWNAVVTFVGVNMDANLKVLRINSNSYGDRWSGYETACKQCFYQSKLGIAPDKYTTDPNTVGFPENVDGITPVTGAFKKPCLVFYSQYAPGFEKAFPRPWNGTKLSDGVLCCLTGYNNQNADVYFMQGSSYIPPVLTHVTDIGQGWYRYEFALPTDTSTSQKLNRTEIKKFITSYPTYKVTDTDIDFTFNS